MMQFLRSAAVVVTVATTLCGCATERHILPSISGDPRSGLQLRTPVLGAVFDGRASRESTDASEQLRSDLHRLYGPAIEWGDYFSKPPQGRVALRIRIVTLGASFGSRLVSSAAYANAVSSARISAAGPWGPVAGIVSSEQSVFAGSLSGEGWWNGAAWVDLEVNDLRGDAPIIFTFPIAAEDRESNIWGYASGDKAARAAWDRVAAQLMRALDAILRTVRDQES